MSKNKKSYLQIAFYLCIVGLLLLPVGFCVDFINGVGEYNLFSRVGAILTLFGIVLEFQLSLDISIKRKYIPGERIQMSDLANFFNETEEEKKYKPFAHVIVILGTLVWGFGDLVFKMI